MSCTETVMARAHHERGVGETRLPFPRKAGDPDAARSGRRLASSFSTGTRAGKARAWASGFLRKSLAHAGLERFNRVGRAESPVTRCRLKV
jgi:hypothetical protein